MHTAFIAHLAQVVNSNIGALPEKAMNTFEKQSQMPAGADELYRWHARPGAFERLAPPWETMETVEAHGGIEEGARRVFRIQQGPMAISWEAVHTDHVPGRQFIDRQVRGPFKSFYADIKEALSMKLGVPS